MNYYKMIQPWTHNNNTVCAFVGDDVLSCLLPAHSVVNILSGECIGYIGHIALILATEQVIRPATVQVKSDTSALWLVPSCQSRSHTNSKALHLSIDSVHVHSISNDSSLNKLCSCTKIWIVVEKFEFPGQLDHAKPLAIGAS